MNAPWTRALLSALSALVLLAGGAGCSDTTEECAGDGDCIGAWICVSGRCVDPPGIDAEMDAPEDADEDVAVEEDADESDAEDVLDEPSGTPKVFVDPPNIDFEATGLFVSNFADVHVENQGDGVLTVKAVELELLPSQAFQVLEPFPFPVQLDPGASTLVRVRFQPVFLTDAQATTPFENAVMVKSDAVNSRAVRIPISGLGFPFPERCLTFDSNDVHLGFVPTGDVGTATFELDNCGQEALTVTDVVMTSGDGQLSTAVDGETPLVLAPSEGTMVDVVYEPTGPTLLYTTVLAVTEEGVEAEAMVRAGVTCPEAIAAVEFQGNVRHDALGGYTGSPFNLSATESTDPAHGELLYQWELTTPDGSTDIALEPNLTSAELSLVPDVPGLYVASLTVTSLASGLRSCNTASLTMDVFPQNPPTEIAVFWASEADLDLHLIRSETDGTFGPWGYNSGSINSDDVFFANPNPDFGASGDFDDPRHLGDDSDGFGPEIVLLPALETGRRYKIGVQYARANGGSSVATRVEVKKEGDVIAEYETDMANIGEYWVPAILEPDGSLTAVGQFE